MTAQEIIDAQGGTLAPLSIRIAPELKGKMAQFRKATGKRPSEIVAIALTAFFIGADLPEDSAEDDGKDLKEM